MMSSHAHDLVGFGDRLDSALGAVGHLCVGLDPHPYLLEKWSFSDSASHLREFSYRVIDASVGHVGILKPQVAFFERHGSAGFAVLEEVLDRARSANLLVIADAKRGDIGSTMEAYARTWLTPGSSLEADAVTVSPYLGVGALNHTFDIALESNKGVFVLAATSNPEAAELQSARLRNEPGMHSEAGMPSVAQHVLAQVSDYAVSRIPQMSIGAVVGATVNLEALDIEPSTIAPVPLLVPGVGFQGGTVEEVKRQLGPLAKRAIISETRSLLEAGRDGVSEAISRRAAEVAEAFA